MAKTVNYTPEMEAEMRAVYGAANTTYLRNEAVNELAEKFGRKVQSVRQKLVRMGIYEKREYVSKTGEKPESKAAIVGEIANAVGANVEAFDSLAKANKSVLLVLRDALRDDALTD